MKLHLAFAVLALSSPLFAYAVEDTACGVNSVDDNACGVDVSPDEVKVEGQPDKVADSEARKKAELQAIVSAKAKMAETLNDRRLTHILPPPPPTPPAFCGTTIQSIMPCGLFGTSLPDALPFDLVVGFTYNWKIERLVCGVDPITALFTPTNTTDPVIIRDDINQPTLANCVAAADFLDPELAYQALANGQFWLVTSPFQTFSRCRGTGFPYQIVATCLADAPGDTTGGHDPHFKTWRGERFSYHGECDLVMFKDPEFESGLGFDVHIRTQIRREFSFIAFAALRIGQDVLEVASQGVYWFNGVLNADLPQEISGFAFSHTQPTKKEHVFEVLLGGRERIKLKTYKDFVAVLVEQGKAANFVNSVGLMGNFRTGHMLARDGKTVMDNWNAYGQEWQVLDTEPSLFQAVRLPQHPNVCTLPTPKQTSQLSRRLAATSSDELLAAEKACEQWGEGKDDCVFDVLATGDLDMAVVSGAY
jgi:hypothetical protein